MHDTMLLDELIRLGPTDAYPRPRNLAEVALEYAGLEIDKIRPVPPALRRDHRQGLGDRRAGILRLRDQGRDRHPGGLRGHAPEAIELMEKHGI